MTIGSRSEIRVVLTALSLYLHTIEGCSECGCWPRIELVTTDEQHSTAGVGVGIPQPAPTQAAKDTHHLHSNKAVSRDPASSSLYPGHCTALVSWGLVTGDVDSVLVWLVWRLLAHLLLPTSCCYLLSVAPCAALGEKPWRH